MKKNNAILRFFLTILRTSPHFGRVGQKWGSLVSPPVFQKNQYSSDVQHQEANLFYWRNEKKQNHFTNMPSFLGGGSKVEQSGRFSGFFPAPFRPVINHFLQQPNNTFSSFQSLSDRLVSGQHVSADVLPSWLCMTCESRAWCTWQLRPGVWGCESFCWDCSREPDHHSRYQPSVPAWYFSISMPVSRFSKLLISLIRPRSI